MQNLGLSEGEAGELNYNYYKKLPRIPKLFLGFAFGGIDWGSEKICWRKTAKLGGRGQRRVFENQDGGQDRPPARENSPRGPPV
jgi:hypothetical protein